MTLTVKGISFTNCVPSGAVCSKASAQAEIRGDPIYNELSYSRATEKLRRGVWSEPERNDCFLLPEQQKEKLSQAKTLQY